MTPTSGNSPILEASVDVPLPYHPKVQTYIKDNSELSENEAIANPPKPTRGVRYAIAQGPSMVPGEPNTIAIKTAVDFNYKTLETAASIAGQYNAQLLTLPELFMTGYEFGDTNSGINPVPAQIAANSAAYLDDNGYYSEGGPVSQVAKDNNITIVCPMPWAGTDPAGTNTGVFDVAMVFDNTGALLGKQFKTHLWGIDERMWFDIPWFDATTSPVTQGPGLPHDSSSPYAPFYINEFPVGIGICYDAEFPEVARCLAVNGSLLTVFPTAAPDSILPGQTEPYPDISEHYIPANALTNLNFCSYSNRAGYEYSVDGLGVPSQGLRYSGNSIICNPYGQTMVAPVVNEDALLIADCVYCDYPLTQPADTEYLINRRPELAGYLTNKTVSFPFGKTYTYPDNPPQHQDPAQPDTNENSCG